MAYYKRKKSGDKGTPNIDKADDFAALWTMFAPSYPQPEREVLFAKSIKRKWRADFLWEKEGLIVEIDGGQWSPNGGRHNSDKDREKLNNAALLGYHVLRFSTTMLKNDPLGCVEFTKQCLNKEIK